MCRSHASHVQVSCQSCAGLMPVMCRSHASHVQVSCQSCAGLMPVMCRSHASHVQVSCQSCAGHMPVMCRSHASHVQVTCQSCAGHVSHVQVSCQLCAGHMPVMCRSHAGTQPRPQCIHHMHKVPILTHSNKAFARSVKQAMMNPLSSGLWKSGKMRACVRIVRASVMRDPLCRAKCTHQPTTAFRLFACEWGGRRMGG